MELPKAGDKVHMWQYGSWMSIEAAKKHGWILEIVYVCEYTIGDVKCVNACLKFKNGELMTIDIFEFKNGRYSAGNNAARYQFEIIN